MKERGSPTKRQDALCGQVSKEESPKGKEAENDDQFSGKRLHQKRRRTFGGGDVRNVHHITYRTFRTFRD